MSEPFDKPPDALWEEVARTPFRPATRRRSRSSGIFAAGLVVVGMMAAVVGFVYWETKPEGVAEGGAVVADHGNPDPRPGAPKEPPAPVASDAPSVAENTQPDEPAGRPIARSQTAPQSKARRVPALAGEPAAKEPSGAENNASPAANSPPSRQEAGQFERAVRRVREALAARDLDEAARQLDRAENNAALPAERDQVRQLRALGRQLGLFFEAVRRGLKKYQPAEEITIDGVVAAVIEVGPDRVALFIEGSRRDYTIATMPAKVALFFARSAADEDNPRSAVFFGAFYAVEGDRGRARAMWQAAGAADVPVDDLLPLVAGAPLAAKRQAVPDADALAAARQVLQERFAEAIVAARAPAQRAQLAAGLLASAQGAGNAAEKFAALEQARDWAVAGSDPATALAALDALGQSFDVDVLEPKAKALGASIAGRVSLESAADAAAAAIALSAEAQRAGRAELASSLADTAYAAARKSRDSDLVKRAYQRRSEAQAESRKAKASRSSR